MISERDVASLIGVEVTDTDGDKIGKVGQIYVDPRTGRPNWATVKTGIFGTSESFVPLDDAEEVQGALRVPYAKAVVKDAPRIDSDAELSEAEEDRLYEHYRKRTDADDDTAGDAAAGRDADGDTGRDADGDTGRDADAGGGHDADAAGRHERRERRERREAEDAARASASGEAATADERDASPGRSGGSRGGGVRLRKYVVTEQVQVTVPVTREEIRVEPEPADTAAGSDTDDRG